MDKVIAELNDKIQQKDFFWEGCGFSKMGFKSTIGVVNYVAKLETENCKLKRALWLARAECYKMREFIAREEANSFNHIAWCFSLRQRTYNQWVNQLIRIAKLANKLQNKCLAKAEEYK